VTTPDGTENAAGIDADAVEPDAWGDGIDEVDDGIQLSSALDSFQQDSADDDDGDGDDDDGPQFSEENYQALAAEFSAQPGQADEPGLLDGLDPKVANHIQRLRREAAEKRLLAGELSQRLTAASDEVARLQAWQEDHIRRDVESLAAGHKLIDPREVWHVAELSDFLDERGVIDATKVATLIQERVPEHWRVQVRYPAHGPASRSGATGLAQILPASWAQALARPQE
jgi:hypothetical protein